MKNEKNLRFFYIQHSAGFTSSLKILQAPSPNTCFAPSPAVKWPLDFRSQGLLLPCFGCILTAVDRGAGLAGVPPGLPQRAAAGGAAHAHPNLCVAGKTSVSSRPKLQVAVAHAVV